MQLKYRPEVDGLRAVSLLVIILFHLDMPGIPGGFVAVDIFFIISGFLITSGIASEVHLDSFSFANFYKRRVIRLAPAYILVMVCTILAAMILMLSSELKEFFRSVIYSSFFLANFYLWDNVGGYFSLNSDYVPLLHLWTLAVEEQYYLAWPLAMIIISKLSRRPAVIIAILLLLSVFLSEWAALHYRAAAYYMAPTRAFDLLLGALLAFIPVRNFSAYIHNAISLAACVIIASAILLYSTSTVFPGFNAFLVSFAVALIMIFSHHPKDLVGKLLSTRLMVYFGKVSYPAYLWHWPLISFVHIYQIKIDLLIGTALFAATFILSGLTYSFVEKPARHLKKFKPFHIIVFGFFVPVFVIVLFSYVGIKQDGWSERFSDRINFKADVLLSKAFSERGKCHQGDISSPLKPDSCILGKQNVEPSVLLVGDSHANHFSGFVDELLNVAGLRGYDITQNYTIFLPGLNRYYAENLEKYELKKFKERNDVLKKHISESKYTYVVLGGSFAASLNKGVWEEGLDRNENREVFYKGFSKAVEHIIASGAIPVVLQGSPILEDVLPSCTLNNLRFSKNEKCTFSRRVHNEDFELWDEFLKKLQHSFVQLRVVNVVELICDQEECYSEINDVPLYQDKSHLNHYAAKFLGRLYLENHENPFGHKMKTLVDDL